MTNPRGHVLVIEDEDDLREAVVFQLQDDGFVTTEAVNGVQALKILEGQAFDAVVTDMLMPGKSGIDVLAAMRANGLLTPVIIITGQASREQTITALRLGAFSLIDKPFRGEDLLRLLDRAIIAGRSGDLGGGNTP